MEIIESEKSNQIANKENKMNLNNIKTNEFYLVTFPYFLKKLKCNKQQTKVLN